MNLRQMLQSFAPVPAPLSENDQHTAIAKARKAGMAARAIDSYTSYPGWNEQILAAFGLSGRNYTVASVEDALGVPAIFRGVSLIANTIGMLAVETFRDGALLQSGMAPRLVARPNPFQTGHRFYRDSGFYLASRGELWWWVAKRDGDDLPISLVCVPPWEIRVDGDENRLQPRIYWTIGGKEREMDPRDMRQITWMPDGLRGVGPLQMCGAAVSVAVESQNWAAQFYAEGGYPSIVIKAAGSLGEGEDGTHEADALREQFRDKPHNTPRVIDEGIESVNEFGVNPQGAQMLDARLANRGDVANMFGIPGALLEYSAPGSSLTYQNVQEVFRMWVRTGLQNQFLSPIEQELSDLLPRSTTAHFNLDAFERADPKARWETYKIMSEVLGPDEASRIANEAEGLAPGDIEFMPVPPAPPQAFPTQLPIARSAEPVRCNGRRYLRGLLKPCGKLLAEAGPFVGTCPRCGATYEGAVA